jgi:hypothetical protein
MRKLSVVLSLFLAACGGIDNTKRDACLAIQVGTPLSSFGIEGASNWLNKGYSGDSLGEHPTLSCCKACNWGASSCNCGGANCSDPALRADGPFELGGTTYKGGCGDHSSGLSHCSVWARDGQVVGAWYYCQQ